MNTSVDFFKKNFQNNHKNFFLCMKSFLRSKSHEKVKTPPQAIAPSKSVTSLNISVANNPISCMSFTSNSNCQTLKNSEECAEFIMKKPLCRTQRIKPPNKSKENEIVVVANNKENLLPVNQKRSYSKNYQKKRQILEKNSNTCSGKFIRKNIEKNNEVVYYEEQGPEREIPVSFIEMFERQAIITIQRFFRKHLKERATRETQRIFAENRMLREENLGLLREKKEIELEMRTKIETGLMKQKDEISNIIREYDAFIRKLITDKKVLSGNCQKYCECYEKITNEFVVFKEKNAETRSRVSIGRSDQDEYEKRQIQVLWEENNRLKTDFVEEIKKVQRKQAEDLIFMEEKARQVLRIQDANIRDLAMEINELKKNIFEFSE